jgi:hypothetical protein
MHLLNHGDINLPTKNKMYGYITSSLIILASEINETSEQKSCPYNVKTFPGRMNMMLGEPIRNS